MIAIFSPSWGITETHRGIMINIIFIIFQFLCISITFVHSRRWSQARDMRRCKGESQKSLSTSQWVCVLDLWDSSFISHSPSWLPSSFFQCESWIISKHNSMSFARHPSPPLSFSSSCHCFHHLVVILDPSHRTHFFLSSSAFSIIAFDFDFEKSGSLRSCYCFGVPFGMWSENENNHKIRIK